MANYPNNIKFHQSILKMLITGFSSGTPGNFTDLYDTDIASKPTSANKGTNTDRKGLLLETGNGQGNGLAVNDQAMKLASSCGQLVWVFVQSATHAGKTVDFHGTDEQGNLTENAVAFQACTGGLAGAWIFATSTKKFKTMATIDLNGLGGNPLDFEVYQESWGMIGKYGNNYFRLDCELKLGDASNHGYFGDKGIIAEWTLDGNWLLMEGYATGDKGHLYFGEYNDENEKTGKNGCVLISKRCAYFASKITDLYIYNTVFVDYTKLANLDLAGTNGRIWNCRLEGTGMISTAGNLDINNIVMSDVGCPLSSLSTTGNISKITVLKCDYVVRAVMFTNFTLKNVYARDFIKVFFLFAYRGTAYMVDCDLDWTNFFTGMWSTGIIYRQYSFNLKVIDKNGSNVNGAKVYLKRANGDQALSDTDAGETYASTTTGTITEQTVTMGYYSSTGGSNLQPSATEGHGKFELEIKKAGYKSYKMKFTLDGKFNEKIMLAKILDFNASKRINFNTQ